MFTSAMIKPRACPHRQAHTTGPGCGGTVLAGALLHSPLLGCPGEGQLPRHPWENPAPRGACSHRGEGRSETCLLHVHALLLLISSLSYSCSYLFCPFMPSAGGFNLYYFFFKSRDRCIRCPPQVNAYPLPRRTGEGLPSCQSPLCPFDLTWW